MQAIGDMAHKSNHGGWRFDGERRQHSRVPWRGPAMLDSQAAYQAGRCRDLSAGGVSVMVDEPMPVGTRVEIYFELPTGVAVEAMAEVVRAAGRRIALRFVDLDRRARTALVAFCELSGVRRLVLEQPSAP